MQDKTAFDDLKRAKEEEYFRKKEQELIEKLRRRAELQAERRDMAEASGIADEDVLRDLQELGYTRETVRLWHLVPLLHVAWIDGDVTNQERERLLELARARGVEDDGPAHQQLVDWISHRPPRDFFEGTLRAIRHLLASLPAGAQEACRRDLVSCATQIAETSGGLLGLIPNVSGAERELIERFATELAHDHQSATQQVMAEI
jgi:hypothetical protein